MSGVKGFDIERMTAARLARVRMVMGYAATGTHSKKDIAWETGLHPHTIKELVRVANLIYDQDKPGYVLFWDHSDGYRLKDTNDPEAFAQAKSRRVAAIKTESRGVSHQCDVLEPVDVFGALNALREVYGVARQADPAPRLHPSLEPRPSTLRRLFGAGARA